MTGVTIDMECRVEIRESQCGFFRHYFLCHCESFFYSFSSTAIWHPLMLVWRVVRICVIFWSICRDRSSLFLWNFVIALEFFFVSAMQRIALLFFGIGWIPSRVIQYPIYSISGLARNDISIFYTCCPLIQCHKYCLSRFLVYHWIRFHISVIIVTTIVLINRNVCILWYYFREICLFIFGI